MSDVSISYPGYKAESVTASQEMIMQVAKLSNFNVLIQQKIIGGVSSEFRLYCQKCRASRVFSDLYFLKGTSTQLAETTGFCEAHAHTVSQVVDIEEPVGRRFREE